MVGNENSSAHNNVIVKCFRHSNNESLIFFIMKFILVVYTGVILFTNTQSIIPIEWCVNYLVGKRYALTSDIVNRRQYCVNFSSVESETANTVCVVIRGKQTLISYLYPNGVMLCQQTQTSLVQHQSRTFCNLYIHNEFAIWIYSSFGFLSSTWWYSSSSG